MISLMKRSRKERDKLNIDWYLKHKGKLIGKWAYRRVYDIKWEPDLVMKKSISGHRWIGHNLWEYEISIQQDVQLECNKNFKKMYPRVICVSNCWVYSIVEKAIVCDKLPDKIMKGHLWDTKAENFWYIWDDFIKLDFGLCVESINKAFNQKLISSEKYKV